MDNFCTLNVGKNMENRIHWILEFFVDPLISFFQNRESGFLGVRNRKRLRDTGGVYV